MRPDGAVVAMVGGRSYAQSQYNRAVQASGSRARHSSCSTIMPPCGKGFAPDDEILDAPIDVRGWQPENYGHRYHGEVTLADAFANSLNDATVRLSQQVGIGQVIAAARDLGLRAPLKDNPSLALGTSEVSLLDLTSAYAAVRAGKAPVNPWGISGVKMPNDPQYLPVDHHDEPQHSLGQYQAELSICFRAWLSTAPAVPRRYKALRPARPERPRTTGMPGSSASMTLSSSASGSAMTITAR